MEQPILAQLKKFAPGAKPDVLAAIVNGWQYALAAGINTPLRFQHFMAQLAHESGGLKRLVESLNYTTAEGIREKWPSRFKDNRAAAPYVRKAQALANKVYNGRMGNAEDSNDGWTYRGRGLIQTTGRDGYRAMGTAIGVPLEQQPALLEDADIAFRVACKEWEQRKCNALADRDDVVAVTKKINGGTTGLVDRKEWLQKAKETFKDTSKPAAVSGGLADNMSRAQIRNVQRLLDEKGYPEVGEADGLWGPRTRGALSSFQLDNPKNVDANDGTLTERTLAYLPIAPNRPVDSARANATAATVAMSSPGVIQPSITTEKQGFWASLAASVAALLTGTAEYLGEGFRIAGEYREYLTLPLFFVAVAGVSAYFGWWRPYRQKQASIKSYRIGKVV